MDEHKEQSREIKQRKLDKWDERRHCENETKVIAKGKQERLRKLDKGDEGDIAKAQQDVG